MSAKSKIKKAPKPHGWEGPKGKGKPPFPGAAPPIHLRNKKAEPEKKPAAPKRPTSA